MMIKACPTCKLEFSVWPYEFKRRKYCSKTCQNQGQTGLPNPNRNRRVFKSCPTCQKEFSVKKSREQIAVYCSRGCMAEGYKKPRVLLGCLNCGKEFPERDNQSRRNAKFCSLPCRNKYRVGDKHPNWIEYDGDRKEAIKQKRRDYNKKYYLDQKHKEQQHNRLRKYKLKRREILSGHHWSEWIELLKNHDNRCYYCGVKMTKKLEPKQRTRDHKIPLSKGGTDSICNIVPACRSCNSAKGTKSQEEFINNRNNVTLNSMPSGWISVPSESHLRT
jgi:hypothetical protein